MPAVPPLGALAPAPTLASAARPSEGWAARRMRALLWVWRRAAVRLGLLAVLYKRQGFHGARLRRMVLVSYHTGRQQRSPAALLHIWRQAAMRVGTAKVLRLRRTGLAGVAKYALGKTRGDAAAAAAAAADKLATARGEVAELRARLGEKQGQLEAAAVEVRSLRARVAADQAVDTAALRVAKEVAEARVRQADEAVVALRHTKGTCGRLQEINKQLMAALLREQAARRKTHNELEEALGKVRM